MHPRPEQVSKNCLNNTPAPGAR